MFYEMAIPSITCADLHILSRLDNCDGNLLCETIIDITTPVATFNFVSHVHLKIRAVSLDFDLGTLRKKFFDICWTISACNKGADALGNRSA